MDLDSITRKEKLSTVKLHASQYVVALVLFVLGVGLWRLQILGASGYRVLAEQNRIRKVPVLAPRGRIFDREGRIIVDNYPSVSCYLLREQQKNLDADLPLIAAGLHLSLDQIQNTLRHFQAAPKYQPIPLKQDITPDEQAFIEAHRNELPELETLDEQRRLYPARRLRRASARLRRRGLRGRPQPIPLRLLLARRRRRQVRRGRGL